VELQIRDPDIKPSCLMILAGILRASSEIGWVKRVYLWGSSATVTLVVVVAKRYRPKQVLVRF
jgi:hypothetical protein